MKADPSGTLSEQKRAEAAWFSPSQNTVRDRRWCGNCRFSDFSGAAPRCQKLELATRVRAVCAYWSHAYWSHNTGARTADDR